MLLLSINVDLINFTIKNLNFFMYLSHNLILNFLLVLFFLLLSN